MPNKNYLAGTRFERKLKKGWEAEGNICLRTAGSHGFCDIVVIDKFGNVSFVQCKVCATTAAAKRLQKQFLANPPIPASDKYVVFLATYSKEHKETEFVWL